MITPNLLGADTPGAKAAAAASAAAASNVELRKRTIEAAMDNTSGLETPVAGVGLAAGQLFRVLPERQVPLQPTAMLGSTHTYDVTGVTGAARGEEVGFHRVIPLNINCI